MSTNTSKKFTQYGTHGHCDILNWPRGRISENRGPAADKEYWGHMDHNEVYWHLLTSTVWLTYSSLVLLPCGPSAPPFLWGCRSSLSPGKYTGLKVKPTQYVSQNIFFWTKSPFVMGHVSYVMCHVSCVMCPVSCVMCHVSCVMCFVSCVMCHVSCVVVHEWLVVVCFQVI